MYVCRTSWSASCESSPLDVRSSSLFPSLPRTIWTPLVRHILKYYNCHGYPPSLLPFTITIITPPIFLLRRLGRFRRRAGIRESNLDDCRNGTVQFHFRQRYSGKPLTYRHTYMHSVRSSLFSVLLCWSTVVHFPPPCALGVPNSGGLQDEVPAIHFECERPRAVLARLRHRRKLSGQLQRPTHERTVVVVGSRRSAQHSYSYIHILFRLWIRNCFLLF